MTQHKYPYIELKMNKTTTKNKKQKKKQKNISKICVGKIYIIQHLNKIRMKIKNIKDT